MQEDQQGMLPGADPTIVAENVKTLRRQGIDEPNAIRIATGLAKVWAGKISDDTAKAVAQKEAEFSQPAPGGPGDSPFHMAFSRLFGAGAVPQGDVPVRTSDDMKAMAVRPRAANAGKDINLPKEKK